ncbi:hypothetical protein R0J93_23735, partial [Pseudoalteromonas sp. SIMBA_148]
TVLKCHRQTNVGDPLYGGSCECRFQDAFHSISLTGFDIGSGSRIFRNTDLFSATVKKNGKLLREVKNLSFFCQL